MKPKVAEIPPKTNSTHQHVARSPK